MADHKIKIEIASPYIGTKEVSYVDLPDDWHELSQDDRCHYLDDLWDNAVAQYIEGGPYVVDENGQEV